MTADENKEVPSCQDICDSFLFFQKLFKVRGELVRSLHHQVDKFVTHLVGSFDGVVNITWTVVVQNGYYLLGLVEILNAFYRHASVSTLWRAKRAGLGTLTVIPLA